MAIICTEIKTSEEFFDIINKTEKPVLVDFWAKWCGPCKMQAPIIDEVAEEYKDKIAVLKVDVDEVFDLAVKLSVAAIPTVAVYLGGEQKERTVGLSSKAELTEIIKKYI